MKEVNLNYNIPLTTIFRYIKSGKIYKNKIYFYDINQIKNIDHLKYKYL
jgi:hypothetical protein